MNLNELRDEIDKNDDKLIKLFICRMELVKQIAYIKKEAGSLTEDPKREEEILNRILPNLDDEITPHAHTLFTTLFNISRKYQNELNF